MAPAARQADAVVAAPRARPRSLVLRGAVGVVAAVVALAVAYVDPWAGRPPSWLRLSEHVDLSPLPNVLVLMAVMWFVLPRVSYRRRDVLLMLVPLYGVWVVGLAFSRLVALPYRDWRPRDDERAALRQVAGSGRYYVLCAGGSGSDGPSAASGASSAAV